MSSSILSTGLRVSSSFLSTTAADLFRTSPEALSSSAQDTYVAASAFEKSRALAGLVKDGEETKREESASSITPFQKVALAITLVVGAIAALFTVKRKVDREEGKLQAELAARAREAQESAQLRAKLLDQSHLEKYSAPLRSNIIGAWMELGDERRAEVLRGEFNLREIDPKLVTMSPPPVWSARVGALLQEEAVLRETLAPLKQGAELSAKERHQRTLGAANGMREIGDKFAEVQLHAYAAKAFMEAGGLYETLGPGELGMMAVVGAYRSASLHAGLAGDDDLSKGADRMTEVVQVRSRLHNQFASFKPFLLPEGADPKVAADLVARYIVGDGDLRDQVIEYRSVTKLPGTQYPFPTLKPGWEDVVSRIIAEFDVAAMAGVPAAEQLEAAPAEAPIVSAIGEQAALRLFGAGRHSDAQVERLFDETMRVYDALSEGARHRIEETAALRHEAFIFFGGKLRPSGWIINYMNKLAHGETAAGGKLPLGRGEVGNAEKPRTFDAADVAKETGKVR